VSLDIRFHRILTQRPDATNVAGFQTWLKLHRYVKRGEKGIRIVVPHVRKVETDDGEDKRITGFGVGTVFDVSQTNGEPLPTVDVPVLEGEEGLELSDRLSGLVAREGLSLEHRPAEAMPRDVMGFYARGERAIVVREGAPLQMAKTLAHELGHHFAGLPDTREESETTAEAVAYIVCASQGLDTGARSFPYVATWSRDPAVFKQVLGTVQRVSAQIIDGLEPVTAPTTEVLSNPAPEPDVSAAVPPHQVRRAMRRSEAAALTPPAQKEVQHEQHSPRDLAKALIRPYVQRGESVASLAASMMGAASADGYAQIGGYAALPGDVNAEHGRSVRLRRDEVAVTQVGGAPCLHRFSLAELHAEILQEALQPRLF